MKFYIASGFENKAEVQTLAAALTLAGHTHTYDWTRQEEPRLRYDMAGINEADTKVYMEGWKEICAAEVAGVRDANILIVLLPGARGTHTELGMAISRHIPILICTHDSIFFDKLNGELCPFYYHETVTPIVGSMGVWITKVGEFMKNWLNGFRCRNERPNGVCIELRQKCVGDRCESAYGKCEFCRTFEYARRLEDCDYCVCGQEMGD